MKIVMAASEAAPFIKTGGLGDVLDALPQALSDLPGMEITVFLPYYKSIKQNPSIPVQEVASFTMPLSWRESYVGILRLKSPRRKLKIYFIDNNDYFWRDSIYGCLDDGERFAFYAKAVLAAMDCLDIRPDILHCHDWQAALVPLFLRSDYRGRFPGMKTVLTIHNLEYQGWANADFLSNVLGLGEAYRGIVSCDGAVNFLKTGIVLADAVTTVSRTYAEEITTPWFGQNLCGILQQERQKLSGIVNGINTRRFDPAADPDLTVHFSGADYAEKKPLARRALRTELGLAQDEHAPILAMVSRLAGHKGIDLLCYAADRVMQTTNAQLVVCGSGEHRYEAALEALVGRYPGRCAAYIGFHPNLAGRIYAGCDIYLMPSRSEPCGLSQLIAMRYGAVPVVHTVGGLKDTVPAFDETTGAGRGFTFQSYNGDDFLNAIHRACALFCEKPAVWHKLIAQNMSLDFSWKAPAAEYLRLYRELCGQ